MGDCLNDVSVVYLYDDRSSESLDIEEIGAYLERMLPAVKVKVAGDFFPGDMEDRELDGLARGLAGCKVRDLVDPEVDFEPMYGEVQFEKRRLTEPDAKGAGVLYDGHRLSALLRGLIPDDRWMMDTVHLIFTNRLFGTFDRNDGRYHARVVICGYPSLISTTGIVEAPAKPREFYAIKQRIASVDVNVPVDVIKEQFKGRFIEADDDRMTEVLKGYALQVIFYHLTYDPFCEDRRCRLYNAHWQEEVIEAQLGEGELCERHRALLHELAKREQGT